MDTNSGLAVLKENLESKLGKLIETRTTFEFSVSSLDKQLMDCQESWEARFNVYRKRTSLWAKGLGEAKSKIVTLKCENSMQRDLLMELKVALTEKEAALKRKGNDANVMSNSISSLYASAKEVQHIQVRNRELEDEAAEWRDAAAKERQMADERIEGLMRENG